MSAHGGGKDISLELVLFSGDRVRFRRFELTRGAVHPYFLATYLGLAVILSQTNLFAAIIHLTAVMRLLVMSLCVLAVVLPLVLFLFAIESLQRPGTVLRLHNTRLMVVFSVFASVAYAYLVYVRPGRGMVDPAHFLVIWVWIYLLMEGFVHVLMLVVMRRVLQAMRRGEEAVSVDPVHLTDIEIKGQPVRLADLTRVTADGNYIRVVTLREQHFLPGPFGPVADSLPPGLGMRVSRSDWVARAAVLRVHRSGRSVTLDLADGTSVPVAQVRRKAVLDWIKATGQGGGSSEGSATSTQTG